MWRFLAGGVSALLLVAAGFVLFRSGARPERLLPTMPQAQATTAAAPEPLPDTVPAAPPATREQKRFDRYDKDRDGKITRDEYLMARRKAFAKLDTNHDGMLSFDEWAAKSEAKFATADADRSGTLTRTEFATTAVQHKPRATVPCAPAAPAGDD